MKPWRIQCITCVESGTDTEWKVKTEGQANMIKDTHISDNDGHKVKVWKIG